MIKLKNRKNKKPSLKPPAQLLSSSMRNLLLMIAGEFDCMSRVLGIVTPRDVFDTTNKDMTEPEVDAVVRRLKKAVEHGIIRRER